MALKFIAMGSNVLVGSTCIAYGSITSPLIGGDLLGYLFWKNLKTGLTAGEAFFQAKVELVREMNKRQGYLDGEDQKTLISFVLYGDPLFASETKNKKAKSPSRMINHLAVKTVSDHYTDDKEIDPISEEMIQQAKQVVETYLPGMENGDVHITKQNVISDIKQNRNSFVGSKHKAAKVEPADRFMVTISKAVPTTLRTHHHYARITMDSKGKMVKLAVSR
jgi:hypothetical protein